MAPEVVDRAEEREKKPPVACLGWQVSTGLLPRPVKL